MSPALGTTILKDTKVSGNTHFIHARICGLLNTETVGVTVTLGVILIESLLLQYTQEQTSG
jgi:hypothetical protein